MPNISTDVLRVPISLVVVGVLALFASGCGGAARSPAGGLVVAVDEADFHISAPSHLAAGEYILSVHNEGPTDHELIVAPTGTGTLPLRADGLTVDEEALQSSEPGSLEPGAPGSTRLLRVRLTPGRYILFCNMEGHYMAGMHTEVVVSE